MATPFQYSRQPLKSFYFLYFVITALIIRLPFWFLTAAVPAWRPKRSWTFKRSFMASTLSATVSFLFDVGPDVIQVLEREPKPSSIPGMSVKTPYLVWVEGVPAEMIKGEVAEMAKANKISPARVPAYWYGLCAGNGNYGQQATAEEKVLYHFHGGGYIMGTGSPKGFNAVLPKSILRQCSTVFQRALSLSYRLSSSSPFEASNPFPAALMDAIAGYHYLVHEVGFQPQNIIVSGDSAGGSLALAFARYLATNIIPGLPVPGALILLSPSSNWSYAVSHDDAKLSSIVCNARTDYVMPFFTTGYSARSLLGALPLSTLRTNAYFSPSSLEVEPSTIGILKGLFAGFPPTCIVAGGAEICVDDIRILRDRMCLELGQGPKGVRYLEYEDAIHDFLLVDWHEPERGDALKTIATWLESL